MIKQPFMRGLFFILFCCMLVSFCVFSTNRQHFEPHEIIVNETTEYFEMFSDSSPEFKRSVSKDTYEKNLDLEKEYRQYGRKHNMMASITNDAALNPLSESDMQPLAIIYPLAITLRKKRYFNYSGRKFCARI